MKQKSRGALLGQLGHRCAWLMLFLLQLRLMASFTWRLGDQFLFEPHWFVYKLLLHVILVSDYVEGLIIFRQSNRLIKQWFLISSLNEPVTFEVLNTIMREWLLLGTGYTDSFWLCQRNVKNKGLERTLKCGHHSQQLNKIKYFVLKHPNVHLHTARASE